jgi:hypothetical protein
VRSVGNRHTSHLLFFALALIAATAVTVWQLDLDEMLKAAISNAVAVQDYKPDGIGVFWSPTRLN